MDIACLKNTGIYQVYSMARILHILKLRSKEMEQLKSCEILDELSKLGITSTAEAVEYLNEYSEYYSADRQKDEPAKKE
jgi:hypothetical protein